MEDLALGPVNEDDLREIFAVLSFRTLLTRVLKLRGGNGTQHIAQAAVLDEKSAPDGQEAPEALSLVSNKIIDDLPSSAVDSRVASVAEIQELASAGKSFVHVEINDGRLVGLGIATMKERLNWNGEDKDSALELLKHGGFGGWDTKAMRKKLHSLGIWPDVITDDALLVSYLVDPISKDLYPDSIIRQYAGIDVVRQDPNELLSESDPSLDAWVYAVICAVLIPQLEDTGQLSIYRDIELPASEVLSRMEITGIAMDSFELQTQFDELTLEVEQIAIEAYEIIGHEVNLASPKQLQVVLFEELGMQGTKALKTGYSTNAEALSTLFEQTEHPFLERLLAHRDSTKLRQMTETLLKAIGDDGRIHTSYSQVGTSTGRLSSESPNLQNIPIKTDRGQRLRSAFIAGPGYETLLTADYSQIEMRIMAHLSEDDGLIEAFRLGEDLHNFVGARLYGVEPSDVTGQMRSKVKAMSYGLVYGLSEFGLGRQLRITGKEAKQLMSDYFDRFGGVKRYLDTVVQRAKALGYTTTVYGRRRPFPDLNSKIFQVRENARRAALNAPIQGTAADIMKLAMIAVKQKMDAQNLTSQLLLQVHDELVFAVAPGELETLRELAVSAMQEVVTLTVPLEVHVGIGVNWELAGH
jgi:DNA polymerase-1